MKWPKTSRARRRWIILTIEILLIIIVFYAVRSWTQRELAAGAAPDFRSSLLTGEMISLDDYRGQPLLVHFWATWCRVCRLEQGAIDAIASDWPVLTVAIHSGDADAVSRYLAEQDLAWATVVDEDGTLAATYGVQGVPTSFVLGRDGEIRFREIGYTTAWGLRLRLWLAGR